MSDPQKSPTPNPDEIPGRATGNGVPQELGRFKSLEAKQRSLGNLKPPRRPGDPPLNPNNLGGRPKKEGIFTSAARKFARKKFPGDPADRTYGQLVVESMFKQAIKGNVFAAQLLFERLDGRLALPTEAELPATIVVNIHRNVERRDCETVRNVVEGRIVTNEIEPRLLADNSNGGTNGHGK